ncbi:FkbM family methyltransferase [Sphingomonas pruni]|uniref:FkbM family methyltransferase n=1 Tax=Sphingomonas pruni TaxID=40683 RepID=UPI00082C8F0B|nr:FkbM family methyltransferase [Sphingomonas pruni]
MVQVLKSETPVSMLRHIAEVATRRLIWKLHLPRRYGRLPIYVSPANALKFLKPGDGKFDPFLLWLADNFVKSNSVVWDIGANGGVFSMLASSKAKAVVAFEPDPFNISLIRRTIGANPQSAIQLVPKALSEAAGETVLNIPSRSRSVSSIGEIPMGYMSGGLRESMRVEMTTADACLDNYPAPTFIKCDIEGAEAMMLRGAQRLLTEARPTVCMEVRLGTREEVANQFTRHGYRMFTADDAMTPLSSLTDIEEVVAVPQD